MNYRYWQLRNVGSYKKNLKRTFLYTIFDQVEFQVNKNLRSRQRDQVNKNLRPRQRDQVKNRRPENLALR